MASKEPEPKRQKGSELPKKRYTPSPVNPNKARTNHLQWEEYFMAVAFLSAQRSKDPNSQVGACVTNDENKIVGIGYNGMPNGCSDSELPWGRNDEWLDSKYPYVCHAELNAILNKNSSDVKGCRIYVALFPCNECAKVIIQSGIKEVVYYSDKYHTKPSMVASKKLLELAGVDYRQYVPKMKQVTIDFTAIDPDVHLSNGGVVEPTDLCQLAAEKSGVVEQAETTAGSKQAGGQAAAPSSNVQPVQIGPVVQRPTRKGMVRKASEMIQVVVN